MSMPELGSTDSRPVRLLPITMPTFSATTLGKWHGSALCVGEDPETFFPPHGDPGTRARQICASCPVRCDCLSHATAADEHGVWGGLDQRERRNLKRRQQRRNAAQAVNDSAGGAA